MKVLGRTLACLVLGASGAACGSPGGALPPPLECNPAAPETPAGQSPVRGYFVNLVEAETAMYRPTDEFLARWPSRKFSRQSDFREDLAAAADEAACAAQVMRAIAPPDERYAPFDRVLDTALTGYIEAMSLGREAAESRNVSTFREWLRAVDGIRPAIEAARANLPQR